MIYENLVGFQTSENQGMGACWTFGVTGALESAVIKALNLTGDAHEKIEIGRASCRERV